MDAILSKCIDTIFKKREIIGLDSLSLACRHYHTSTKEISVTVIAHPCPYPYPMLFIPKVVPLRDRENRKEGGIMKNLLGSVLGSAGDRIGWSRSATIVADIRGWEYIPAPERVSETD